MKKIKIFTILLFLLILVFPVFSQGFLHGGVVTLENGVRIWLEGDGIRYSEWSYYIDLVEVLDGSTLRVIVNGKTKDMPIYGIKSPGIDQPLGKEAKEWVEQYIQKHSDYFRLRFSDYSDEAIDASNTYFYEILSEGLAWIPPEILQEYPTTPGINTYHSMLEEYQNEARSHMLGVWQHTDPTPPWERYNK